MAAYAVVDYSVEKPTVAEVIAAFETLLETLDSTTNPIRLIDIYPGRNGNWVGVIVYDG